MALHRTTEDVLLSGIDADIEILQRDGIVARKGAFARAFIERMREDMMTAFWEAIQRLGGAVGRGPRRWYIELHPQALTGFVDMLFSPIYQLTRAKMRGGEQAVDDLLVGLSRSISDERLDLRGCRRNSR